MDIWKDGYVYGWMDVCTGASNIVLSIESDINSANISTCRDGDSFETRRSRRFWDQEVAPKPEEINTINDIELILAEYGDIRDLPDAGGATFPIFRDDGGKPWRIKYN